MSFPEKDFLKDLHKNDWVIDELIYKLTCVHDKGWESHWLIT